MASLTPLTFSEWDAPLHGIIATCVETAGAILGSLVNGTQVTAGAIQGAANQLYNTFDASGHRLASYGGATNFAAEQRILSQEGVKTDLLGVGGSSPSQLQRTITGFLSQGRPVGLGFFDASVTAPQNPYNRNVHGHAAVAEGFDSTGAFVADPNAPRGSGLFHYPWAELARGVDSLLVPTAPAKNMGGSGDSVPVLSGIGDFFQSLNPVSGVDQAITQFGNSLKADILKVMFILLGIMLLGFGLYLLFAPQVNQAVSAGAQSAAKGAAQAAVVAA